MDGGGGRYCVGSRVITMLLKSKILVRRDGLVEMSQLVSKMMVVGSSYLVKFSFQVIMERRRGWGG